MSSEEKKEGRVTVSWVIENFSLLSLSAKEDESLLESPFWKIKNTRGDPIRMKLIVNHSGPNIKIFLYWYKYDFYEESIEVSLIPSCGTDVPLRSGSDENMLFFILEKNKLFGKKTQSFLPNGTLTLLCRIREERIKSCEVHIVSVIYSVNLVWNIERLKSTYTSVIEKSNILFYLVLTNEENISHVFEIEGLPNTDCRFSFVDCSIFFENSHKTVLHRKYNPTRTTLTAVIEGIPPRNYINFKLKMKSIVALHNFCQEEIEQPLTSKSVKDLLKSSEVGAKFSNKTLSEDLLQLYRDSLHHDATLNTEDKSFSAHKNILSARSPVFRAMFEKDDMSEGRSGVVDIDDVSSETLDRMLVFLYSDSLEGVDWIEASELYYAADKYDILPLKKKCSDILNAGLAVGNVCDVLILADNHSDEQLMGHAVDFIRDHPEVFSSSEWEKLEENNARFTTRIYREVYVQKGQKNSRSQKEESKKSVWSWNTLHLRGLTASY